MVVARVGVRGHTVCGISVEAFAGLNDGLWPNG